MDAYDMGSHLFVPIEELRRLERVAVGRICRCGDCQCCAEYAKDLAIKKAMIDAIQNRILTRVRKKGE